MSNDQFYAGLRVIGEEIVVALASLGIAKNSVDLKWNHGLIAAGSLPEFVELEVSTSPSKRVLVRFSREQLEDSADRIDRLEVRAIVGRVAAQLAGPRPG